MLSPHLAEKVTSLLPALKTTGQDFVFIGPCPFHSEQLASLVVDFGADSASCLTCHYGENIQTLVDDIQTTPSDSNAPFQSKSLLEVGPPGVGTRYGYLITKEVSQSIHNHLFANKVKELNSAVKQLSHLVALMKLWIDPA
jgi:hypothetical protein